MLFNPLPNDNILDWSKLKQFADDNFKFDENSRQFSKQVENTLGKGEIARYAECTSVVPMNLEHNHAGDEHKLRCSILTLNASFTKIVAFVASVDQDQAAQNMQPYL